MANNKTRYVNTRFWNDGYVSQLDPIEKLLFMYFLTNEHTNISGIYELPLKMIAIETGIDESMIKKIMPRLNAKIRYIDGYVVIKNFVKHQQLKSELTVKGIINCLTDLKRDFLENVVSKGYYTIPDSILQGAYKGLICPLNYLDSNLDLDSNLEEAYTNNKDDSKESYGELKGVKLTQDEYAKLVELMGDKNTNMLIFELDTYMASKGKRYKSHYATILNWAKMKADKQITKGRGLAQ